jgi:hypothetical protein
VAGYAQVADHRSMVFDDVRNRAYAAAITAAVVPDSIVLDLGAGLGILGLLAATAGVRRVYLLEPEDTLDLALQVARRNGLADRVVPLHHKVADAELPEPVDLIVSVFTGNCLLDEDLLPGLFAARDRFLAPGGRLVPDRATMRVVPVSASAFHDKRIGIWSQPAQGLLFDGARGYAANTVYFESTADLESEALAAYATIAALDFATATEASCRGRVAFDVVRDGTCHGVLGWFDMRLGEAWLSTAPDAPRTHWRQAFFPVDPPIDVRAGDRIDLELIRPEYGDWTWIVTAGDAVQRHSTFLSAARSPDSMRKRADSYRPRIGPKGNAVQFVLSRMDGATESTRIARELVERFPDAYPRLDDARRFVDGLVVRFG